MFQRVCEEKNVDKSDMPAAIAAISHAKNSLRKVNGFSPRQHVFGSDEALPEDLVDGPHAPTSARGSSSTAWPVTTNEAPGKVPVWS